MKLPDIDYTCPTSRADALAILSDTSRDIRVLAGGQSLLAALNFRLGEPDLLVDINRIEDLQGIAVVGDCVQIGAMTRHAQLADSDVIAQHLPLLSRAIQEVAHPAIRHRGTFGGSVALADPAAELPACLLACNGRIVIAGANSERTVNADDYFLGLYETALQPGELIVRIDIPSHGNSRHRFAFDEFARRHGDFASAGIAATWQDDGTVSDARIALFGLSDRPVRASTAESLLNGRPLGATSIAAAADMVTEAIAVYADATASEAMKRHLARVLLKRALSKCLAQ